MRATPVVLAYLGSVAAVAAMMLRLELSTCTNNRFPAPPYSCTSPTPATSFGSPALPVMMSPSSTTRSWVDYFSGSIIAAFSIAKYISGCSNQLRLPPSLKLNEAPPVELFSLGIQKATLLPSTMAAIDVL